MELKAKIMKLGQNFLQSKRISAQIANVAKLKPDDIVLEIGPGKGILTEKILERAKKVIAVEKDKALVELLKEKFTEEIKSGKLKLIHDDILKFNPTSYALNAKRYKVVANIPYYITGSLIRLLLSGANQPKAIILMLQKEVQHQIVSITHPQIQKTIVGSFAHCQLFRLTGENSFTQFGGFQVIPVLTHPFKCWVQIPSHFMVILLLRETKVDYCC